jgi:hypothetical protein
VVGLEQGSDGDEWLLTLVTGHPVRWPPSRTGFVT